MADLPKCSKCGVDTPTSDDKIRDAETIICESCAAEAEQERQRAELEMLNAEKWMG